LLVSFTLPAVVSDAPQAGQDCARYSGFIAGPFVPTADVAKAIYAVVADGISPSILQRYPIIVVEDENDHWSVSQRELGSDRPGMVRFGGGQLYMNIDKCTGAISKAAYNR
jgi:hypothetical protein